QSRSARRRQPVAGRDSLSAPPAVWLSLSRSLPACRAALRGRAAATGADRRGATGGVPLSAGRARGAHDTSIDALAASKIYVTIYLGVGAPERCSVRSSEEATCPDCRSRAGGSAPDPPVESPRFSSVRWWSSPVAAMASRRWELLRTRSLTGPRN